MIHLVRLLELVKHNKQKEEYCKEHKIRLEKIYYKKNHNITWEELKEALYGI